MSEQLFDDGTDPGTPAVGGTTAHGDHARPARPGAGVPLAARLRPRDLSEYVGQLDALGPGKPLRAMLDRGDLRSLILWGPPGVGKTSLATVIASHVDAAFLELSAVTAGVKDVRRIIDEGRSRLELRDRRTVLFVDEIHRFNKGQQDALLPGVEAGWVTLIGATTENPFFELNAPLLSRCQLIRLTALTDDDLHGLLERACTDPERGFGGRVRVDPDAAEHLVHLADGDARAVLTALEVAAAAAGVDAGATAVPVDPGAPPVVVTLDDVADAVQRFRYDKAADGHYDQVSAFIKSMRGSDPDAAAYWLVRMLESGEDPRFLARRMVIFASEDVGLADRQALPTAVAAFDALDKVGLPEARYALVHAAIALAVAPKSNAVTRAIGAALESVRRHGNTDVPAHLRDGHNRGARSLGHGVGYDYPHDHASGFAPAQTYLPDRLVGTVLYEPSRHGHEAAVADRLAELRDQARAARRATEQHQPEPPPRTTPPNAPSAEETPQP
ncbi:replication-associated recombination protein A [Nitriliruptor alkaliphilus]|uniref:replication-associated recombination protein A n=1 Tax=Nitriliruptor alkaliphilus TaxID=427918 RepID=UPI0009F937D1|nr:replication-associated recombination protein A [Nitriliruptor alkaliphilus]